MKQILVGVDGTPAARAAADGAAAMARLLGQEVVLVAVVEPPRLVAPGAPMGPRPDPVHSEEEQLRGVLASEARRLAEGGITARTELRYGRAAHELAAMAERADVELVVVGRQGGGVLTRALHASQAARLVHACKKPVMVFPGG